MRYFIVFYMVQSALNKLLCDTCIECDHFPSRARFIAKVKEETGYIAVAITNIIEVSKEDFDTWNVK